MTRKLTHLSLFTGIGGIDLAAEWAGFETVGQVEWGDFQTKVLQKHWPDVPKWRDIHDFDGQQFRNDHAGGQSVTLLSGGFPCQPHSVAGERAASLDERDLWPEYRRIISEIKPRWILAENVPGLRTSEHGRFFRNILRDLAEMGFDAGWGSIRASWVGANHQRERIFVIAYANRQRRICMGKSKEIQRHRFPEKSDISERQAQSWAAATDLLLDGKRMLTDGSGVRHRNDDELSRGVDRLTGLGNAVVPQQVYPILQMIASIEKGENQ